MLLILLMSFYIYFVWFGGFFMFFYYWIFWCLSLFTLLCFGCLQAGGHGYFMSIVSVGRELDKVACQGFLVEGNLSVFSLVEIGSSLWSTVDLYYVVSFGVSWLLCGPRAAIFAKCSVLHSCFAEELQWCLLH